MSFVALDKFDRPELPVFYRHNGLGLELSLNQHNEMISVYTTQGEFVGEFGSEAWARWTDQERRDLLNDMLTWLPCERDTEFQPNEVGVVDRLAALCRAVGT